jgi:predicted amidohydrolase
MDREWKLGLAQMRVEGGQPSANLARALSQIEAAAAAGADLVVLPEAMDLGWTHPSARSLAEPIPGGARYEALAAVARRHRIFVCAGLTESNETRTFNSAVLLDPEGRLLLHHRKLNELEIGHECYDQGDRLGVVQTELGTLGLMICADAFARGQVVARTLGLMGAQVILSPSAWAVPADHDNVREPYGGLWLDNYGAVARDYRLWISGVSNVGPLVAGPWSGRFCIGSSLVVGPDGEAVLQGPYGVEAEALLFAQVRPVGRPARGDGWEGWWRGVGSSVRTNVVSG